MVLAAALVAGSLQHAPALAAPPDARQLTEEPVVLVEVPDAEGTEDGMLAMFASKERLVFADGSAIELTFHSEDIEEVGSESMGSLSFFQRFEVPAPAPAGFPGLAPCQGRANLLTASQLDENPRELIFEFHNENPDLDHFGSAAQDCVRSIFRIVHDLAKVASLAPAGAVASTPDQWTGGGESALHDEGDPAANPPVENPGKWLKHVDPNPLDNTRTVVLRLHADSGSGQRGDPVAMIARCQSNKTELYIVWNDYLGNDAYAGRGDYKYLTLRFGSRKAVEERWGTSTDHEATFAPGWAGNLLKEDQMVVRTTRFNESLITAVFDIRGLRGPLGELTETCGWSIE